MDPNLPKSAMEFYQMEYDIFKPMKTCWPNLSEAH